MIRGDIAGTMDARMLRACCAAAIVVAMLAGCSKAGSEPTQPQIDPVDEFLGMLDTFPFWFNIVTP
jgi:hypothetical protein